MGSDEWTRRNIQQDATVEFMVDELNDAVSRNDTEQIAEISA